MAKEDSSKQPKKSDTNDIESLIHAYKKPVAEFEVLMNDLQDKVKAQYDAASKEIVRIDRGIKELSSTIDEFQNYDFDGLKKNLEYLKQIENFANKIDLNKLNYALEKIMSLQGGASADEVLDKYVKAEQAVNSIDQKVAVIHNTFKRIDEAPEKIEKIQQGLKSLEETYKIYEEFKISREDLMKIRAFKNNLDDIVAKSQELLDRWTKMYEGPKIQMPFPMPAAPPAMPAAEPLHKEKPKEAYKASTPKPKSKYKTIVFNE